MAESIIEQKSVTLNTDICLRMFEFVMYFSVLDIKPPDGKQNIRKYLVERMSIDVKN